MCIFFQNTFNRLVTDAFLIDVLRNKFGLTWYEETENVLLSLLLKFYVIHDNVLADNVQKRLNKILEKYQKKLKEKEVIFIVRDCNVNPSAPETTSQKSVPQSDGLVARIRARDVQSDVIRGSKSF